MASKNGDQVANAGTLFRWPPSGFPTEAPIMAGLCRAAIVAAFNPFRSPTPSCDPAGTVPLKRTATAAEIEEAIRRNSGVLGEALLVEGKEDEDEE